MQSNINKIVESVIGDRTVKSYKTYAVAEQKAEEARIKGEQSFMLSDDQKFVPMMYVIVQRSDGRFTPVFLMTQFLRINECGGYIGVFSQMGYISI